MASTAPLSARLASALKTTRSRQHDLEQLSPFELKDYLISLAGERQKSAANSMLNAGRGNPNWIATEPRDAFFLLGQFAMGEARRTHDAGMMAGMPGKTGAAGRLQKFLAKRRTEPGAKFLAGVLKYGVKVKGFDPDAWIHELTDGIIGDNYPVPPRALVHTEQILHDYLIKEMCDGRPPAGKFDLFPVEGGTAAMCYIFDSLMENGLLKQGDTIALFLPTFTPYIEIAHLDRFQFNIVAINANSVREDGTHDWHYPSAEIDKLANPKIKLAVTVNPSNPPSVAFSPVEMTQIVKIIRKNPDLVLVTDDVYGTFVPNFRSLMAEVPHNTICVYSFSKNFGCTGWRLGVIATHEKNTMDRRIAALPPAWKARLNKRYGAMTMTPEKLKFIDRLVADSRNVALNHTAGLSLPQQVQMGFFALSHLLDTKDNYKHMTMEIVRRRRDALWRGLGLPLPPEDPQRGWYYVELDFMVWAKNTYGDAFCNYMQRNYEPVDFLFRLAEKSGVVLMDGGGFGGPPWSIRISLANLDESDYPKIGRYMRESAVEYVQAWQGGDLVHSGPNAADGKKVTKKAAKKAVKNAVKKAASVVPEHQAPSKAAPAKKVVAKKAIPKKAVAKTVAATKASMKKTVVKKTAVKKAPVRKAVAR